MRRPLLLVGTAAVALLACSSVEAKVKATLKDRFDQIISTFMGDPAANADIDLKHVLDAWRGMHPKPLESLSVEDARRQPVPIDGAVKLLKEQNKPLDPAATPVKTMTFQTEAGPLVARIYEPAGATPDKALPVVVFFHGGGFVLDSVPSSDASARAIADAAGAIVVAPTYRLAPEHKFPASQTDALEAYKWAIANTASFGGDPDKIALAGEGAGGLLAVDAAIAARDAKLPKAAALVLITPAAGIDLKTNSWLEDSSARPWNKEAVAWALNLYLANPDEKNDPRIDIVGKADVSDLPPTTIVTAEDDPLRSDGERLGGKLRIATVAVAMRDYPGMTHDFFGMGAVVEKAAQAQAFVGTELKKAFTPKANQTVALEDLGIAPYPEAPGPANDVTPPTMSPATVPVAKQPTAPK